MRIAICDDDQASRMSVLSMLKDNYPDAEISIFGDGDNLMHSADIFDFVILDVEMPGVNGIAIKDRLEKKSHCPKIIYLTNYEQYMQEAFGHDVLGYVIKSNHARITEYIDRELDRQALFSPLVIDGHRFDTATITHIQADGAYVRLFTVDRCYYYGLSLATLAKRLNPLVFSQPHRSFLVNLGHVKEIENDHVVLLDGTAVPVARLRRKAFSDDYFAFLRNH